MAKEEYVPHLCSKVLSPSLSDFEAFLDTLEAERNQFLQDDSDYEEDATDHVPKQGVESLDDMHSRMIAIEDILLEESSEEDDIPIVKTLPSTATKITKRKKKSKTLCCGHMKLWQNPLACHPSIGMESQQQNERRNVLRKRDWFNPQGPRQASHMWR